MTRIDFYSNVPDKILYACRLVRKARAADCRLVVFAQDRTQLAKIDEALWTFSDTDFLPHVIADDPLANRTPVLLAEAGMTGLPHHELMINLSSQTPPDFARFERLLEIVAADEEDKAAGRERYSYYKHRGYPLSHFVADKA
jgi:DNA polymerase-3 subunit chi